MTRLKLLWLMLFLGCFAFNAQAADLGLSNSDCAEILEKWATDPDSVSQQAVDTCQEMLATAPVAAAPLAAVAAAAADPCSGSGASGSVYCWGPWAALAPAAAGNPLPGPALDVKEIDQRPEMAALYDAELEPLSSPPVATCTPGLPCGFATVVVGVSSRADAEDTEFASFDLASDGTQFTVAPGEAGEIQSVSGMTTGYSPRGDQFETLQAGGADGSERSRLIARVLRNTDGEIEQAADVWAHGDSASGQAQSGFFAWGRTTSQADLDRLNGDSVTRSVAFSGPMSVDNQTMGTMTVNFGSQPTWNGSWNNPAWSFGAGGQVSGVDLVSTPDQFTSNVGANSFVQGALLGEERRRAIAHIIDVDVQGAGRIRDVGLLPEAVAAPPGNP